VEFVILGALCVIAMLYSSVGHGGASGYLAILSLTVYGSMDSAWLKQHVWCLNLVVAAIAFYYYNKAGFHVFRLTFPFIVSSIPCAMIGGYLEINGSIYDVLLSITLVWAAYRLFSIKENGVGDDVNLPSFSIALPLGGIIGFISGVVGVGGGIFLSPILLLKKWGSAKIVAATSALFIWVNSMSGIVGAGLSGQLIVEFEVVIPFAFSVLVGGIIGSRYGSKIASQLTIRRLLVVVLIIAAVKKIIEII
jgi:hypothetical protein